MRRVSFPSDVHLRRLQIFVVVAACLSVLAGALEAQFPETLRDAACSGPLAALLPECQAGGGGQMDASVTPRPKVLDATPLTGAAAAAPKTDTEKPRPTAPAVREREAESTEFQRFAASSLGQVLPIFGASLFEHVPTTFAPVDRIPVSADYVIGPGDEVLLRVWGQVNFNTALTVDRLGEVYLPQVGNVRLAGLRYDALTGFLRAQLGRVFRNFDLNVSMGQLRSIQIYVVGHARRPGSYTVSSMSTLVNALFACGGPSAHGSMREIELKRGGSVVARFDLYDLLLRGDKSKDAILQPGDVLYIPPVGSQAAVAGSVKAPAIYEFRGRATVEDLLNLAGGPSPVADTGRLTLERIGPNGVRATYELKDRAGWSKTPVEDGDILRLMTINPRFENAVILRGNVASPGRFPYRPGMRLSDVIPNKESLITPDYWRKRNTLGFVAPQDMIPGEPGAEAARQHTRTELDRRTPEINWAYAVVERQDSRDLTTQLLPFHLGKLVLERDPNQNLELKPGDVITIFSQADIRVPVSQQNRFVRLEGEFQQAGVYSVKAGETLGEVVARAGGFTAEAFLYGAEFTRVAVKQEQQRRLNQFIQELEREIDEAARQQMAAAASPQGAAEFSARLGYERRFVESLRAVEPTGRIVLRLDPERPDLGKLLALPVEDGDRLYIPPRPTTVHVIGAVYNPNTFLYEPRYTVRDYLAKAGGLTRSADARRMFVIRADGTVVARGKNPFGGGRSFENMRLNAGDALVAPEYVMRVSTGKTVREWSQIAAQFALGAAAVNVLR